MEIRESWALWRMEFYVKDFVAYLRREVSLWGKSKDNILLLVGKYEHFQMCEEGQNGCANEFTKDSVKFVDRPYTFKGIGQNFLDEARQAICPNMNKFNCDQFILSGQWLNETLQQRPDGALLIEANVNDEDCDQTPETILNRIVTYTSKSNSWNPDNDDLEFSIGYREFNPALGTNNKVLNLKYPNLVIPDEDPRQSNLSDPSELFRPRVQQTRFYGQFKFAFSLDNNLLGDSVNSLLDVPQSYNYPLNEPYIIVGSENLRIKSILFDPSACCPTCPE